MKVFGIGWHKTATHSLQEALNVLGFKGLHYPYELYARFENSGVSARNYTEKYSSFTDFPVPLYFRELDALCPESKFILTVRDSDSWVQSVENHFQIMNTPQSRYNGLSEHKYKNDSGIPIDKIHIKAYGQKDFEPTHFLKCYERHNRNVQQFFKNRRDDLLVVDIAQNDKWKILSAFLQTEIPNVPYPMKYSTESRLNEVCF